ncbi:MAG: hypothetical protein ABSC48_05185 [Terracidiphilus sp.]|jgi:hypothetical protein
MKIPWLNSVIVVLLCTVYLFCSSMLAQSNSASICVAPTDIENPTTCGTPELCTPGPISFKLDDRPIAPWPKAECLKIDGLDAAKKHRVIVYRAGKAQQSFSFRFPVYGSNNACLFLNDLYWTVQLWDRKGAPSCKCK